MKAKKIILISLMILLSSCNNQESSNRDLQVSADTANEITRNYVENLDRSFFGFVADNPIEVSEGESKEVLVNFTTIDSPVTSVQVILEFDPAKVEISQIEKASENLIYMQDFIGDNQLRFMAFDRYPFFGQEIPIFKFKVSQKAGAEKGPTEIKFVDTKALKGDSSNTNTTVEDNLPIIPLLLK